MESVKETEERLKNILSYFGINKKPISVYIDLLKNKGSSALQISKRTGIHRSNTYDALRYLIEKGFVKEVLEKDKRTFVAISPDKIKDFIEEKNKEFELILPHLNELKDKNHLDNSIDISEGPFALRAAARDLLYLDSPIITYGASDETVEAFGRPFLNEFHKERIKKRIFMRHIYNNSAKSRINYLSKKPYTEARCLSGKYDTNVCTVVCKDLVLLFIFSRPLIIIKIKNKSVADSYKRYFEIMWKSAE